MKISPALLLFAATVMHAAPEFVGVLSSQNSGSLYAVSISPNSPSQWTSVGSTIDGYLVVEYRAKDEVLVLQRGEILLNLPLRVAKVRNSEKQPLAASSGTL